MWKTFQHDGSLYMIKFTQNDNLSFYLTDLKSIWLQTISQESLLQDFQECNPFFDLKTEKAIDEVLTLLTQIAEAEVSLTHTEDDVSLSVKCFKEKFIVQFVFKFVKSTSDVFLREVTVPLVQTVKHLEACQNMLCNLVQKKDRELEEYKLEKGSISREDLITEKFEDSMLCSIDDNNSMMNVFGEPKFWEAFSKKYGHIKTRLEDVTVDPWNHIKRKRKVYSSKTAMKKGKGINYNKSE